MMGLVRFLTALEFIGFFVEVVPLVVVTAALSLS